MKTNNINQEDKIAKQKAKYEAEKEQERKRRISLLSGNLKPIKTSFHLNVGEYAYFAFQTSRMADRDYIESHTKGAGIGEGFGRVGVGIAKSTTTQERVTKLETVDTGTLLFTNKRILFVGKEVVSVAYQDILAAEFNGAIMTIKYPSMIKNECYDIEKEPDAALYFKGLMRLLGKDKSKVNEADIDMSDYPEFVLPPKEKVKKKLSLRNKIFIGIGILLFMAIFLKGLIQPSIIIDVIVLICSVMALPILYVMNFFMKNQYAVEVQQFKRIFLWSIILLVSLFIIYGVTSSSTTNTTAAKSTAVPTKSEAQVVKKKDEKPTPVPTEDCSQSADPQMCITMEINREPRLNATTDFSNAGLIVTNKDSVDWRLCTVTIGTSENINSAYEVSGWDIQFPANQTTTVPWGDFTQDNGNRFNYSTTQPNDIELDCSVNKEQEHLRIN